MNWGRAPPRTARTPRTSKRLYVELNRPIRNKSRDPVEPETPARTPRPRMAWQRGFTDTKTFTSVAEQTKSLELIMSSSRKGKAAEIQEWIEKFGPGPIEILRKVAAESTDLSRVLTLICDELERFPPERLQDQIEELDDGTVQALNGIKVRSCDLQKQAREMQEEEDALMEKLAEVTERKRIVDEENRVCHVLLNESTFEEHAKSMLETTEARQRVPSKKELSSKVPSHTELWGENNHLRGEMQKLEQKINEHRKYHRDFTTRRALAVVKSKLIQDVEFIEEVSAT